MVQMRNMEYLVVVVVISFIFNRIQRYRNRKTFVNTSIHVTLKHCCILLVVIREAVRLIMLTTKTTIFLDYSSINVLMCSLLIWTLLHQFKDRLCLRKCGLKIWSINNCVCWGHGSYYRQTNEEHSVAPSIYRYCSCTYLSRCDGQVALP